MEPTQIGPETGTATAMRRPSRIKAGVAAVLIAGALSTWGVASVFAADPSASASDSSGSSTDSTADDCPAHADTSTSDSSTDTST